MKVAVWDTYVKKKDGTIMNFDILVPEEETNTEVIYGYGKEYLKTKSLPDYPLTSNHCTLCHFETPTDAVKESIHQKGYFIVEIKNC
ncbi:MAG TPA: DUF2024 family protein [Cyclobacteriaceae bacterium]|jgi:hypothetical protein|nr:DUF2024 family protein [Cytophagales bacterium]HMR57869.1 DUF2024 family protein [Cyclobacteriaceae bacterium]HNT49714.1 DUF2024 family protein [Cyclobacteriaceae bacterium]HRE67888.1 DUF2024 family protein [Cyclobacteriaceae bacterium]HRF32076.1 DUF2024 family protein [Cyclobacteriaceae bacterium]